jgi:FtsH-binding integral membrane protein
MSSHGTGVNTTGIMSVMPTSSVHGALRHRLLLLRSVRAAGTPVPASLTAVQLLTAVAPAVTAAVLGLLVGRVDGASGSGVFRAALLPLALFGAVLLLGYLAQSATAPLEYLLRQQLYGLQATAYALGDRADGSPARKAPGVSP